MVGLAVVLLLTWFQAAVGATGSSGDTGLVPPKKAARIAARWGIELVSLRRTAADTMIDLRYRVIDSEKAAPFVDRTVHATLIDQATGTATGVPSTSKLGPMRQTMRFGTPPEGRVLFTLFANPGRRIETGSKVTIRIGDFRVKNLVVE